MAGAHVYWGHGLQVRLVCVDTPTSLPCAHTTLPEESAPIGSPQTCPIQARATCGSPGHAEGLYGATNAKLRVSRPRCAGHAALGE